MPKSTDTVKALFDETLEASVLGAILKRNDLFDRVSDILSQEIFFLPIHKQIFTEIQKNLNQGLAADPLSISVVMERTFKSLEKNETINPEYIWKIVDNTLSLRGIVAHANTLLDLYMRRELEDISKVLATEIHDDWERKSNEIMSETEAQLYQLATKGHVSWNLESVETIATNTVNLLENRMKSGDRFTGIATGFYDLDSVLNGLHPSDLVILAGRPGMGKTGFALELAYHIAHTRMLDNTRGGKAIFFSLEMSREQLANRLLGRLSGVPIYKLRAGTLSQQDMPVLREAMQQMKHVPLMIEDTAYVNMELIRTISRHQQRIDGLDIIFIDYLQLIQGHDWARRQNRVVEITAIARELKLLAKELKVPVVALSQLSRGVESREDKRPQLSDLRESGAIEQDADVVMFLYRPAYYERKPQKRANENDEAFVTREQEYNEYMDTYKNLVEIIVEKHRHGATGSAELIFDPVLMRFSNKVKEETL